MLDEPAVIYQLLEAVTRREVIFFAVLLSAARRASRVGDGEAESVRVLVKEAAEKRRLAGARWTGNDDWLVLLKSLPLAVSNCKGCCATEDEIPVGAIIVRRCIAF